MSNLDLFNSLVIKYMQLHWNLVGNLAWYWQNHQCGLEESPFETHEKTKQEHDQ